MSRMSPRDPDWNKGVARETFLNEAVKPGRERLLPLKKDGKMKSFTALVKAAAIAESLQGGMGFPSCSLACANVCVPVLSVIATRQSKRVHRVICECWSAIPPWSILSTSRRRDRPRSRQTDRQNVRLRAARSVPDAAQRSVCPG
jgi:hypothetical protein